MLGPLGVLTFRVVLTEPPAIRQWLFTPAWFRLWFWLCISAPISGDFLPSLVRLFNPGCSGLHSVFPASYESQRSYWLFSLFIFLLVVRTEWWPSSSLYAEMENSTCVDMLHGSIIQSLGDTCCWEAFHPPDSLVLLSLGLTAGRHSDIPVLKPADLSPDEML